MSINCLKIQNEEQSQIYSLKGRKFSQNIGTTDQVRKHFTNKLKTDRDTEPGGQTLS